MGLDFAYVDILSTGVTVANNANIVFTGIFNRPTPTRISLVGGSVTINDTGYYQLSYGAVVSALATTFQLRITDAAANTFNPGQGYYLETIAAGGAQFVHAHTVVIKIAPGVGSLTTPPFTVNLTNISGANRTLQNLTSTATGPVAWMSIIKLL